MCIRDSSYSTRTTGKSTHFLTIIEPFEEKDAAMIQTVEARSESELKVVLKDGTEHSISIRGLADAKQPTVTFRELKAGKVVAEENSWASAGAPLAR